MKSILVSVVVLSLALPVGAHAGDLCLDAAGANPPTFEKPVIIGRGFTVPKKNKCKPFVGVIVTRIPALPSSVTGSACTSFDGANVSFTLVASIAPSPAAFGSGIDLYFGAFLKPGDGTGLMSAFVGNSTANNPMTAYECHNAYPDNL